MQVAVKNKTSSAEHSTNDNSNTNSADSSDTNSADVNTNTASVNGDSATNTNTVTAETNTNSSVNANTTATTQQIMLPSWANVNLQNPSWDVFIVLFFVVASLLYGLSLGRDRIIIILVSIYMALAVVQALPDFVLKITLNQQVAFQITAFISIFLVLFFLTSRSALMRTLGHNASDGGGWIQTMIFSLLHVGLLICITMSFLPNDLLNKFAPLTKQIFTGEWENSAGLLHQWLP